MADVWDAADAANDQRWIDAVIYEQQQRKDTDMSERIDHAAEARRRLLSASGGHTAAAHVMAQLSTTEAVLALVEQQRIANLISLANSSSSQLSEQTATDAADALVAFHLHEEPGMGGWWELRPDVAAALGIDTEGDDNE